MKKILTGALVAAAMLAGTASATTYKLNGGANNNSVFNQTGVTASTWNATLTVNASGNSSLAGSFLGSNGTTYSINVTLLDTYFSGAKQMWGNFTGSIVGGGVTTVLYDVSGAARNSMDAVIGINAAPYNANTTLQEFGFWSMNAAGVHNFDLNTTVTCTSATANANGTCGAATSSSGGSVPLPGSAALTGLVLVGLASRKLFKRA